MSAIFNWLLISSNCCAMIAEQTCCLHESNYPANTDPEDRMCASEACLRVSTRAQDFLRTRLCERLILS